jgi:hypothetical protein
MDQILVLLGGPAACGVICYVLCSKVIPAMIAAFRAEMAAERTAHGEHIDKLVSRLEGVERGINLIQKQLLTSREAEEPLPTGPRPAA